MRRQAAKFFRFLRAEPFVTVTGSKRSTQTYEHLGVGGGRTKQYRLGAWPLRTPPPPSSLANTHKISGKPPPLLTSWNEALTLTIGERERQREFVLFEPAAFCSMATRRSC